MYIHVLYWAFIIIPNTYPIPAEHTVSLLCTYYIYLVMMHMYKYAFVIVHVVTHPEEEMIRHVGNVLY